MNGVKLSLDNNVNGTNVVTKNWTTAFTNDFIDGGDGWYYYKKTLAAEASVQVLDSIALNESLISTSPYYDDYKCIKEGDGCVVKDCYHLTPPNCDAINPLKNNLYTCTENGESCQQTIKHCEELPSQYCGLYSQSLFYSKERNGKCIKNEKTQKCELRTCETTPTTECNSFILDDEDEICALNSEGNKCEIVKCSSLESSKCSTFIPNNKGVKCVEKDGGSGCKIKSIDCQDLPIDECYYFHSNNENEACVPDGEQCKKTSCEALDPTKCSLFKSINEEKQCVSISGSCALKKCEELPIDQCGKFLTDDLPDECILMDEKCELSRKSCSKLPIKYCSENIVSEWCILDSKGNKCVNSNDGSYKDDDSESESKDKDKSSKSSKSSMILFSISSIYLLLLML